MELRTGDGFYGFGTRWYAAILDFLYHPAAEKAA